MNAFILWSLDTSRQEASEALYSARFRGIFRDPIRFSIGSWNEIATPFGLGLAELSQAMTDEIQFDYVIFGLWNLFGI